MSSSLPTETIALAQSLKEEAQRLDNSDKLSSYIDEFIIPEGLIYLDGNSLGALSKNAQIRAREVVEQQWGNSLIASWNEHDWINLPLVVGDKIAPIIGASKHSVIACDSISVNLFKLLSAALRLQLSTHKGVEAKRSIVLSQSDNFPTDLYMAQGLESLLQDLTGTNSLCELVTKPSNDIIDYLNEQGEHIAVLLLSHINFKNGQIFNMHEITEVAHENGVLVIWDLAHSAGVIPLELEACKVDFAVGCTYKYLNGGPGSPGFVYVSKTHMNDFQQPLSGWLGHQSPFTFNNEYEKANDVRQMLSGTPSIVSMSVLDAALDVFKNINMSDIRDKSIALNEFFQRAVKLACNEDTGLSTQHPLMLACEEDAHKRGSQISYSHPHAYAICQALIAKGVIADFRAPNILRIGFSPLYLSFTKVAIAAATLMRVIDSEIYLDADYQIKQQVT